MVRGLSRTRTDMVPGVSSTPDMGGICMSESTVDLRTVIGFYESGRRVGQPIYLIQGGADDPDPAGGDPAGGDAAGGDPGNSDPDAAPAPAFPADTPVAEMSAEQQAAYWKHQARKHENAYKGVNLTEVQRKAAEFDKLEQAKLTPSEQAVTAAREEGRAAALQEANENAAEAIFIANLTARGIEADEAAEIVADIKLSAFIADGKVDTAKVIARATRIAGASGGGNNGQLVTDMGQGSTRGNRQKPSGLESGAARYEAKHGKRSA